MIIAEPKTILNFISGNFDLMRELFEAQSKNGLIHKEIISNILSRHQSDAKQKLIFYKIIRNKGEDFELRHVYYKLIEFILFEFRPLLPEEIEKYGIAISKLFAEIKKGISGNKNILVDRMRALSQQITEFWEDVEKNTIRLLNETRELKANVNKMDYTEKIQQASYWIEFYIIPLNTILDVNHINSISNKLLDISEFANQKRLNFHDETLRIQFEKLYLQLVQTNDDILHQSKILTKELLPLIERIRTESLILTGWIEFLRNPYKIVTPKMLKVDRENPYSNKIYYNTKEYFEDFLSHKDVVINEEEETANKWIFNKATFKNKLKEQLPVNDFFKWCSTMLSEDKLEFSNDKLFALTSLIFEEDVSVNFSNKNEITELKTKNSKFKVPKIKITDHGIPKKT